MRYAGTVDGFTVRESDTDDVAAVIEGVAMRYGDTFDMGNVRESFGPDAFTPSDVVGAPLTWRHGDPVGRIVHAENREGALWVRGEIANTALGRDAATLTRMGGMGLSVGFEPAEAKWNRARDAVTYTRAGLRELGFTHLPAYSDSGVTAIREEKPMSDSDTMTAPDAAPLPDLSGYATREDVAALRDRIATMDVAPKPAPAPSDDDFLREFGKRLITRAWTDVTLDGTASDITPPPTLVASVLYGRPTFNALGATPLAPEGMDAAWIVDKVWPTVDVQTAEKTLIDSTVPEGEIVKAPVVTIAGGNDVSIQFIQRASVWDMPHILRMYAEQYAVETNVAVCTLLATATQSESVPASLTTDALGTVLGGAAAKVVAGTGKAPSFVSLDPVTFFRIGLAAGYGFPLAGGNVGNANLAGLSFSAFGLPFICDPTLTAGSGGFMVERGSVGVKESPGAPFQMTANVPSKLGVDYAVYGFMASKVLNPGGIVKLIPA